jgi:hypothetical protein
MEFLKLLVTPPKTVLSIIKLAVTGLIPVASAARMNEMDVALVLFVNSVLRANTIKWRPRVSGPSLIAFSSVEFKFFVFNGDFAIDGEEIDKP